MANRIGRYLANNIPGGLALVVAISGTAYAAATIGSADIIDESVRSVDVKNGAISSSDLRDGSVLERDVGAIRWRVVTNPERSENCVVDPPKVGQFCALQFATWTNSGDPWQKARFGRDASGTVFVQGMVHQWGESAGSGEYSPVFILPPGYRPAGVLMFTVSCHVNAIEDGTGSVEVRPSGDIYFREGYTPCNATNSVSISGISFPAS